VESLTRKNETEARALGEEERGREGSGEWVRERRMSHNNMHHVRRNVSNGICDMRRTLFNSFKGEGDRVGDRALGEATVSMPD